MPGLLAHQDRQLTYVTRTQLGGMRFGTDGRRVADVRPDKTKMIWQDCEASR